MNINITFERRNHSNCCDLDPRRFITLAIHVPVVTHGHEIAESCIRNGIIHR